MGALGACAGGGGVLSEGSAGRRGPGLPARWWQGGGLGLEGLHSRPLQELLLLLLPVRIHQLLWHQLHQLQALLDFHQDLKVLAAPYLSTDGDPRHRCLGESWGTLGWR